jgi:hypothetical protein
MRRPPEPPPCGGCRHCRQAADDLDTDSNDGNFDDDLTEYIHSNRAGTFVRLGDVAAIVTKPIPSGKVIQAVRDGCGLRRPAKGEIADDFVLAAYLRDQRPEAFGEAVKARRRADRAEARSLGKLQFERVVKCGLARHLLQKSLVQAIRVRVRAVSEATNRAGLMLLDIVMRYQGGGVPLPEMDQSFFRQLLLADRENPSVDACVADTFASFPSPQRFAGDGQLYSSAAARMVTTFGNSLVYAFEPRLRRYIKTWCKQAPEARGEPWPILKAITNWGTMEELTPEARDFVAEERSHMGDPQTVTASWLKGNPEVVLRMYRRWLSFLENNGAKVFAIVPQFAIRSHFIKLDTVAMYGLMKAEQLFKGNLDDFKADAVTQFESVLKLDGLVAKRQGWKFSRMVETDGVALCVHFKRFKTADELIQDLRRKEAKATSMLATAEKKAARERSPERVQREFKQAKDLRKAERDIVKERAKREKADKRAEEAARLKAMTKEERAEEKQCLKDEAALAKEQAKMAKDAYAPSYEDGDLSEDPGVSPNVTYTVHIVKGKKVRRRFTIGRYNHENGVNRLQHRTGIWLRGVQKEQATLDEVSVKTASHTDVRVHVRRYAAVHAALWDEKTKSRWARGRFDTYVRKPAAVDAFYKGVKRDGAVKRHYYGNASMSSTIAGCKPAPVGLCLKRSKMAFQEIGTTMVDEHLTTQCCWKCLERTRPVANLREGRRRVVRGLVFCDSRTCGCLTNRDFNGAMNIMACGVGPRPRQLARTPVVGTKRTEVRMVTSPRAQYKPWRPPRATPYSSSPLALSQS